MSNDPDLWLKWYCCWKSCDDNNSLQSTQMSKWHCDNIHRTLASLSNSHVVAVFCACAYCVTIWKNNQFVLQIKFPNMFFWDLSLWKKFAPHFMLKNEIFCVNYVVNIGSRINFKTATLYIYIAIASCNQQPQIHMSDENVMPNYLNSISVAAYP